MKAISIINNKIIADDFATYFKPVKISGSLIPCGLIDVPKPAFDEKSDDNAELVLVKVDAFSCNYRDKALILKAALRMQNMETSFSKPVSFFGSDFVGRVIKKGSNVHNLNIGDRVIPNCYYPDGVMPGVVTNEASRGWLRLHYSKLMRISSNLKNHEAAGFSIGAQTSHSMIRRTGIVQGEKALVLSGRSHTSLFTIRTLLKEGIDVTVATTSDWSQDQISFVKPGRIIHVSREKNSLLEIKDIAGKFDVIFDPFFDLHLSEAVRLLKMGGRYITCGFKNQHKNFQEKSDGAHEASITDTMITAMINNVSIIGNCIGTTQDLKMQVDSYDDSSPLIRIDKEFNVNEGSEFLGDTYNNPLRFGKAIMVYED